MKPGLKYLKSAAIVDGVAVALTKWQVSHSSGIECHCFIARR